MKSGQILLSLVLCMGLVGCEEAPKMAAMQAPAQNPSRVIPLPEAAQNDSAGPVDAIVVDKNGDMKQTQYQYDPNQGGVVINNYEEVSGDGASIFFPAFEVGLLWWGGYWVDNEGNYWNGHHYEHVQDRNWHNNWNHYWNHDWNNKWNQHQENHADRSQNRGREGRNRSFDHSRGMNRPANHASRGGGGHR